MVFFHTSKRWSFARNGRGLVVYLLAVLCAAPLLVSSSNARATSDIWLSVDTQQLYLAVMRGDTELKVFENIAIGSKGATRARVRGDETTPLGEFTITDIRPSKRFELFMEINYPNRDHTERAFLEERISAEEYNNLRVDLDQGNPPPQDTSLGGFLGIHGLGWSSPEIHKAVNWTDGCIALTNEQLDELADWVSVGTRVVVR
jgi:murein L,D-transpeptidase YafK